MSLTTWGSLSLRTREARMLISSEVSNMTHIVLSLLMIQTEGLEMNPHTLFFFMNAPLNNEAQNAPKPINFFRKLVG